MIDELLDGEAGWPFGVEREVLLGEFEGGAFSMADRSFCLDRPGIMLAIDGKEMHYSDPICRKEGVYRGIPALLS